MKKHLFQKTKLLCDMKIQTKITLTIISVVAIPILLALIFLTKPLHNMVIADTIKNEQNASALIAPKIEKKVEEITGCMNSITALPFYSRLFYEPVGGELEELAKSDEASDFNNFVNNMVENSQITAVRIYCGLPKESGFFSLPYIRGIFRPESDIGATYWHGIFNGTNCGSLYCPEFYLSRDESLNLGNSAYIVRTALCYKDDVYPTYIAVYYDSDIYGQILKDAASTSGSVSYIINDRDALVVTTDYALSGTYRLKYSDIRDYLLSSNSFVERKVAGVSVYAAFYSIKNSDWFMVNVIPKEPLLDIANKWMFRAFAVAFLCLLAATMISIGVSKSITSRIAKVSSQMKKVHDGPPVAMEMSYSKDEVGELIETYNYMTGEMNELIRKQEETAQELRTAEFNALQAQINPHFLYNTMDMINWMALQGKTKEVSEVVQNLSKFYKLTLSRKKDYSTIADELEHAKVYVELQNMRFNDAIDFVIDVPDELTRYRLPKLTFQPILENSILHGILEKEDKRGTIVLAAWTEGNDIRIIISDDGAGMSDDIRKQILSEERRKLTGSQGTNVAVVNIHRRLQLLYGEKYGLSYVSSEGNGCEVSILIPKQIESSYNKSN